MLFSAMMTVSQAYSQYNTFFKKFSLARIAIGA